MSMPSAMYATLTPVPSTMLCACGVLGFWNAVFVTCNASGSRIGRPGLLGHTGPVCTTGFEEPFAVAAGAFTSMGAALIGRSG